MHSIKLNGKSQSGTEHASKNNPKPCLPTWGQAMTDQTVLSLANAKLQIFPGISDVYIEEGARGEKILKRMVKPSPQRQTTAYWNH